MNRGEDRIERYISDLHGFATLAAFYLLVMVVIFIVSDKDLYSGFLNIKRKFLNWYEFKIQEGIIEE